MKRLSSLFVALAIALSGAGAARGEGVYDYAVAHPVPDAPIATLPAIGDSVPASVSLHTPEGGGPYGYFYYAGRPVIVDLATRSVVRIGS